MFETWGDSYKERSGMLVVSGTNQGFCLTQGADDETPTFLAVKLFFRVLSKK